jgi:hypothetical protein
MQLEGLADHQRLALHAVKQGVPEPLWLISGQFREYLPMCRDEGLISKTLYLPYGAIEAEPAYPATNVQIDSIRRTFNGPDAKFPGLIGVMGNVQTPLLQFPNLFYFTSVMHDSNYLNRSEKDVLLDVSRLLYPERKQLLADCYLALKETDSAKIETLAAQLAEVVEKDRFGRLGIFARKLFPDHRIVAASLLPQLKLQATQQKLLTEITPATPRSQCEKLLTECFDAYLAWDTAHGWHRLWGWEQWPLAGLSSSAIADRLGKTLKSKSDVDALMLHVSQALSAKYGATAVATGCIAPLKSAIERVQGAAR